jgi:pilus assembly protein FimV
MAYGRDEQAEEVLKEAATRSPQRHELKLKLLEIYQQREDIKSFETLAEELYPAGGQGDPETWSKVVKMGAKMNPNNPLFSQHVEDTQPSTVDAGGLLDAADELELPERAASQTHETDLPDEIISQASGPVDPAMHPFPPPDESVDIDAEFDRIKEQIDMPNLSETEPVVEDSAGLSEDDSEMLDFASNERSDLDFDIDLSDADKPQKDELTNEELLKTAQEEEAKTRSPNDDFASEVNEIDIADLDLAEIDEPTLQTNALSSGSDMESIDMPDVGSDNLPTGESGSREPAEESAREVSRNFGVVTGGANAVDESEAGSEKWDEAATKLDLAQAYLNMGDKAGARSIIDEVMKEGSPAQKDQAAVLQARIG